MKNTLVMILVLACISSLNAQKQEIPDPDFRIIRENGQITIYTDDDDYSVTLPGDTAYRLEDPEFIILVNKGKMGIFDPWDLCLICEPVLDSVGHFDEETFLVKHKGKYLVTEAYEFSLRHPLLEFDTIYPMIDPNEEVYNNMYISFIERNGKIGLYNSWYGYEEFIPVKYDEIVLLASHSNGIVYKMRKGKKWGAGDCETYETKIAYDNIAWLTGSCADNYFRVKKKGKYGLVSTWSYGDYVYPPEFDMITFAGESIGNGYFILKKGRKWDVVDDYFPSFEPQYDNVHIMKTDGLTRISMEKDGEITTYEISDH